MQNTIVIDNYFLDNRHIARPYRDGLYAKCGNKPFRNIWADRDIMCRDMMECAYNNTFHPCAEIDKETGKRLPFLDGSHANAVRNLGSMKAIWKQFIRDFALYDKRPEELDLNEIEEQFWQYYIKDNRTKFERSVQIFEDYVRRRRSKIAPEDLAFEQMEMPIFQSESDWIAGCRDYLRHLVYTTPAGYIMELMLFATICTKTGYTFWDASIQDERNGIDGFITTPTKTIPVSLKPSSYKKDYMSPLDETCFVVYQRIGYHLEFVFKTGYELLFN